MVKGTTKKDLHRSKKIKLFKNKVKKKTMTIKPAYFKAKKRETTISIKGAEQVQKNDSNFKLQDHKEENINQLDIETELKKQDDIKEENKLNYDFESLLHRTDLFLNRMSDFININNITIILNSPEDIILKSIINSSDKKQLTRDIKNFLKDLLIKYPEDIEAKDLILECNLLINEFTARDAQTTAIIPITSLVHYETPKEDPPADKNGQLILLTWEDFSYQVEENRIVTVENQEEEKLKFKVTSISNDYADPYIQITGKIFLNDIKTVNSFLEKFKKIVTKELVQAE